MKKLLYIALLFWVGITQAQISTGSEHEFYYGIKNNSTQTVTNPIFVTTQGTDGTYGKVTLENLQGRKAFLSTGLIKNGLISINADPTKYNVTAGIGVITNFDNPEAPTSTIVNFSAVTGRTPAYLNTGNITYIAINASGVIVESASQFTPIQRRDLILLGAVIHSNLTNINVVNNISAPTNADTNQLHDFIEAVGPLNLTGNKYTANGANMQLNKSAGSIFKFGVNFANDWKSPHQLSQPSGTALTFRYRTQNGVEGSDRINLDPTLYDLNNVYTSVPNNKFVIETIVTFQTGLTRILKGQNYYDDLASAKAAIFTRSFIIEPNSLENGIIRGYVIMRNTTTSLQSVTDAEIIEAQKFGGVASGGVALTFANIVTALGYTPANDVDVIHKTGDEVKTGALQATSFTGTYSLQLTNGTDIFSVQQGTIASQAGQPFIKSNKGYYVFQPSNAATSPRFYLIPTTGVSGTSSKFEMFNSDYITDAANYNALNIITNNVNNDIQFGANRLGTAPRLKMVFGGDYVGSALTATSSRLEFFTNDALGLNTAGGAITFGANVTDPFSFSIANQYTFKNPTTNQATRLNIVGNGTAAGVLAYGTGSIRNISTSVIGGTSDYVISTNKTNTGTTLTDQFRIYGSTGNLVLQDGGVFGDGGFRLDVNGTTRLNGAVTITGTPTAPTATAGTNTTQIATTAFVKANTDATAHWTKTVNDIRNSNSGEIEFKPNSQVVVLNSSNVETAKILSNGNFRVLAASGGYFTFDGSSGMYQDGGNKLVFKSVQDGFNFEPTNTSPISGVKSLISFKNLNISPTSGTGQVNIFEFNPVINQTGGANGITRSLYINPTLTAAADFRAIEVTAGKTLLQETTVTTLKTTVYTVATLPTPTGIAYATVSDATAPTYLGTLVGGGAVVTPAFYNGTDWVAH